MSRAKVIFNFQQSEITIQCLQDEKMRYICQRFWVKINKDINSLLFLYGGKILDFDLRFIDQVDPLLSFNNEMHVLVKNLNDSTCPPSLVDNLNNNINQPFSDLGINNNNPFNNNNIQKKTYFNGTYEGQLINGKREGKGVFYFSNGNKYEGDWKNDKKEGKGMAYFISGNRYEGDFKNDIKEGRGIFYYNNGDRYEGDFKNNQREGKGIFYLNNGDRYEGDFKNDKFEGKGKCIE